MFQITAASRTPDYRGYRHQIPVPSVFRPQLNLLKSPSLKISRVRQCMNFAFTIRVLKDFTKSRNYPDCSHSCCFQHCCSCDGRLRLKCDGTRAEKPYFVFAAKRTSPFKSAGGRQFSRLLAADVCASAVVMLDTPCSEVV